GPLGRALNLVVADSHVLVALHVLVRVELLAQVGGRLGRIGLLPVGRGLAGRPESGCAILRALSRPEVAFQLCLLCSEVALLLPSPTLIPGVENLRVARHRLGALGLNALAFEVGREAVGVTVLLALLAELLAESGLRLQAIRGRGPSRSGTFGLPAKEALCRAPPTGRCRHFVVLLLRATQLGHLGFVVGVKVFQLPLHAGHRPKACHHPPPFRRPYESNSICWESPCPMVPATSVACWPNCCAYW